MFLHGIGFRPASISDAVHREVVDALHDTQMPLVLAGMAQIVVGGIAAWQTGDAFIAWLTVVSIVVIGARVFEVLAYRRRTAKEPAPGRAEQALWIDLYAGGATVTAFTIGLIGARSLQLDEPVCSIMTVGFAFGFGAGIVARHALLPVWALVNLTVLSMPLIAGALLRFDLPHIGLAMLLTIYMVGAFEMVRLTFNAGIEQRLLRQKYEELAGIDPMTGLANRSVLATRLTEIVSAGKVALHAIDLDHFKAANDRFGHPVGDALLKDVAGRLKRLAGEHDLVIRMGGDEFVLAQSGIASLQEVERMAAEVFSAVSAPYAIAGHAISIGVSIGIAMSPEDGTTVEALLCSSDEALYQAKTRRGGFVFARDLKAQETSRESGVRERLYAA